MSHQQDAETFRSGCPIKSASPDADGVDTDTVVTDRADVDGVCIGAVDPGSMQAQRALNEYFAELDERLVGGFDRDDAFANDQTLYEPPRGTFLLLRSSANPENVLGCGAVHLLTTETAEIKRMWISPGARGRGFGRLLLTTLERQAVELGAVRVRLDTNSVLLEAIALYETAGYHQIDSYSNNSCAERWFEKQLAPAD